MPGSSLGSLRAAIRACGRETRNFFPIPRNVSRYLRKNATIILTRGLRKARETSVRVRSIRTSIIVAVTRVTIRSEDKNRRVRKFLVTLDCCAAR